MCPSNFREDWLGPVACLDCKGPAVALIEPGEPFGADDADDAGEMLAAGSGPAQHRDHREPHLGELERPLDDGFTDPCPCAYFVFTQIAGPVSQTFVRDDLQGRKFARGESGSEIRR